VVLALPLVRFYQRRSARGLKGPSG
jgi:hypothetical protein